MLRLPIARSTGALMKPGHLRDLLRIIKAYLESPCTKTPPKKNELFAAVQSLLPTGKSLSAKWDKTQLCLVLKTWILSALKLSPFAVQPSLLVRVHASDSKAKKMEHSCYINDGDERILTFAMASPSPTKPARLTVEDLAKSPEGAKRGEAEEFVGEAYDEDFLREIDDLALDTSIGEDVIPTIFYTPRVSGENAEGAYNPLREDGTGPLPCAAIAFPMGTGLPHPLWEDS